jgi:hypothetical protein
MKVVELSWYLFIVDSNYTPGRAVGLIAEQYGRSVEWRSRVTKIEGEISIFRPGPCVLNLGRFLRKVGVFSNKEAVITCLTLLNPVWRNWFCKFQLISLVAIGLRKPYAKTKVGESDTCMMFFFR